MPIGATHAARNVLRTALVGGFAYAVLSCNAPVTLDAVGEAIERSGRNLQSRQGVDAELDVLYEVDGPWLLLVVPRTGLNMHALAGAGLSEAARDRLAESAAGWSGGQYLVQVREESLITRTLAQDAIDIEQQFSVSGRGAVWLAVTFKKVGPAGPPRLVSISANTTRRRN